VSDASPDAPDPEPAAQPEPDAEPENRQETGVDAWRGRFQAGQSGNPGGRPKNKSEFRGLARQMSPLVLTKLFQTALSGGQPANVRAGELILAYAWGKPRTELEIRNQKGKPFEITDPNRPSDEELDRKMAALFEAAAKVANTAGPRVEEDAEDGPEEATAEGASVEP
jgi:hypothetical protein